MNVNDAQQEMRSAFLGGFAGQLVSGFIWLAALLVVGGTLLAAYGPSIFSLGGWLTAVALIIFAFLGRAIVRKEEQQNTVTTL
jgi:hypothetical protein